MRMKDNIPVVALKAISAVDGSDGTFVASIKEEVIEHAEYCIVF